MILRVAEEHNKKTWSVPYFSVPYFSAISLADYKRRDAAGQHADFGIARRYLRIGMCMMKTSQVYIPSRLRKNNVKPEERAGYYLMSWPYWRDKWHKAGALTAAFEATQPLGQWRNMVQRLYDIKLTL